MVEITALTHPDNVTLIAGATQYWRDPQYGHGWADAFIRQVRGRTLFVGPPTPDLAKGVAEAATEVHVVTRGIPDAADAGTLLPEATVWCGDINDVRADGFDTVLMVADAAEVLPLESETRTWRAVVDDVVSRAKDDATIVALVENDLGLHRLSGRFNPRASDLDSDWDPTRTWDATRPRTVEQVRAAFPGAQVHTVWPHPVEVGLLASPDLPPDTLELYAEHASLLPIQGADPGWLVDAFARAGRLADSAPAWLVTLRGEAIADVELVHGDVLIAMPVPEADTRSALGVFAELCAASDLPQIRRLVAAWSTATADGGWDASFGLCQVHLDGEEWVVTPFVPKDVADPVEERWRALAQLAGGMRIRAWRSPWASTASAYRILNHLGLMSGLHTLSEAKAGRLLPPLPDEKSLASGTPQELAALVTKQAREVDTLRSKLRWTELMLDQERLKPASTTVALARAVKKSASSKVTKALRMVRSRLG